MKVNLPLAKNCWAKRSVFVRKFLNFVTVMHAVGLQYQVYNLGFASIDHLVVIVVFAVRQFVSQS